VCAFYMKVPGPQERRCPRSSKDGRVHLAGRRHHLFQFRRDLLLPPPVHHSACHHPAAAEDQNEQQHNDDNSDDHQCRVVVLVQKVALFRAGCPGPWHGLSAACRPSASSWGTSPWSPCLPACAPSCGPSSGLPSSSCRRALSGVG